MSFKFVDRHHVQWKMDIMEKMNEASWAFAVFPQQLLVGTIHP
jgi:hypothetical protein